MIDILSEAVQLIGDPSPVAHWRRVYGGDINDTFYVRTKNREYFVKYRRQLPPRFFSLEKKGLERIRESETVQVPTCYGLKETDRDGFLVMEWITGEKTKKTAEMLGESLARMHRKSGFAFGLEEDNYIGMFVQKNGWFRSWVDFYRERRLLPQIHLAEKKGRIPEALRKKADRVLEHLDKWIPDNVSPSLLHGDLWGGNWIAGEKGVPYLIDPAIFYGHYEFELAFTELFGGFSPGFYVAYNGTNPLSSDYEERKPLYQLFYLLVHLNLFGETYYDPVKRILDRYGD